MSLAATAEPGLIWSDHIGREMLLKPLNSSGDGIESIDRLGLPW